jgi:hypothetical protein
MQMDRQKMMKLLEALHSFADAPKKEHGTE